MVLIFHNLDQSEQFILIGDNSCANTKLLFILDQSSCLIECLVFYDRTLDQFIVKIIIQIYIYIYKNN
jgi:hypothetical protein